MISLYINPISTKILLSVLDGEILVNTYSLEKGDDFSRFPDTVVELVDLYSIDEIWCICGPGAFTRMRIVTLTLNTIALTKNMTLRGCQFFDLIPESLAILQANDREYIVRDQSGNISLIPEEELPPGIYTGYGEKNDFTEDRISIEYKEDYTHISQVFSQMSKTKNLSPLYLKNPHITGSKKNISPS